MKRLFILPVLALGLVVGACDSNDVDDDDMSTVQVRLQPVVGDRAFEVDTPYDVNGATITFGTARLYLSQITLHGDDGEDQTFEADPITVPAKDAADNTITHTVTDKILLVKSDAGFESYALGEAEARRYSGFSFKVGIQGTDNRVDATQVPADHPLAKQTDKNNHWNWSAGYQYLRIDGLVDTTGDGSGDDIWETHLGTENFLSDVRVNQAFTLTAGETVELHLVVDYAEMLADVDLNDPDQRLCHTADNPAVAQKVGNKIPDAFSFQGLDLK